MCSMANSVGDFVPLNEGVLYSIMMVGIQLINNTKSER